MLKLGLARIYLGYMGNMKDSLQHIACFWLFTIVPSLLLSGFLFIPGLIQNICDEGPFEGMDEQIELKPYQCSPPSNNIVAGLQVLFITNFLGNLRFFSSHFWWLSYFSAFELVVESPATAKKHVIYISLLI